MGVFNSILLLGIYLEYTINNKYLYNKNIMFQYIFDVTRLNTGYRIKNKYLLLLL